MRRFDAALRRATPKGHKTFISCTAARQESRLPRYDSSLRAWRTNARELGPDYAGRSEALGGMVRRHPDVHDGQLRLLLPDKRDELRRVPALPGHRKAGPLEQARETLAEEDIIVSQRDTNAGLGHPYDYRPPAGERILRPQPCLPERYSPTVSWLPRGAPSCWLASRTRPRRCGRPDLPRRPSR